MPTPVSPTLPAAIESEEHYRAGALVSMLRLHWFVRLRWAMVIAAFTLLAIERALVPDANRPWQLGVVVGAVALVNFLWMAVSQMLARRLQTAEGAVESAQTIHAARLFANAQVAVDLLLLTLILRFSGGVENPMFVFYLFHMAIGSLLLRRWQAVLQGAWAVLLFTLLGLGQLHGLLTPHYSFLPQIAQYGWFQSTEFVVTVIGIQACGVSGILYFTLHIARRLDERERQLIAANAALRQSQTAIQDLQRRRSRFMQTAAHQLKSPLAVIQTLAGLIRDEIVPAEAVNPTACKIVQRCRDGIEQVTELLTLARVQEADPKRHCTAWVDVGEVVEELCLRFRPVAENKKLSFRQEIRDRGTLHARVERKDLTDCIGNLIENAIKYTPAPGEVEVTLSRQPCPNPRAQAAAKAPNAGDACICLVVRDTGIGIDADALPKGDEAVAGSVFDAFRRGNNALAAEISGTGLGLSIVREVIEQAGGRIRVRSSLGQGTTFTVLFPCHEKVDDQPHIRKVGPDALQVEDPNA